MPWPVQAARGVDDVVLRVAGATLTCVQLQRLAAVVLVDSADRGTPCCAAPCSGSCRGSRAPRDAASQRPADRWKRPSTRRDCIALVRQMIEIAVEAVLDEDVEWLNQKSTSTSWSWIPRVGRAARPSRTRIRPGSRRSYGCRPLVEPEHLRGRVGERVRNALRRVSSLWGRRRGASWSSIQHSVRPWSRHRRDHGVESRGRSRPRFRRCWATAGTEGLGVLPAVSA